MNPIDETIKQKESLEARALLLVSSNSQNLGNTKGVKDMEKVLKIIENYMGWEPFSNKRKRKKEKKKKKEKKRRKRRKIEDIDPHFSIDAYGAMRKALFEGLIDNSKLGKINENYYMCMVTINTVIKEENRKELQELLRKSKIKFNDFLLEDDIKTGKKGLKSLLPHKDVSNIVLHYL